MGSVYKRTASRHTTNTEQGTHSFEIVGYNLKKGIGVGEFIQSGIFTVGGYDWAIRFYPDGIYEHTKDYVSIYLELKSNSEARAFYDLSLLNQDTGVLKSMWSEATPRAFKSSDASRFGPQIGGLLLRSELELEAADYIRDDCLVIECVLTVIKESKVYVAKESEVNVPPSDLSEHFGNLLLEGEGADVTFNVCGEAFAAHKIVLATRSPVFKAELYGQMKERMARSVAVEDMQPDVFRALLHFIYTDSLPAEMDDLDDRDYSEMIRHLLVAADIYAMDRLKLMCQSILCESYIDLYTVADTLALADQHSCHKLKDACIEFIASSDDIDAVVPTPGYANLKRTCPYVLVDVLERTSKFRKG